MMDQLGAILTALSGLLIAAGAFYSQKGKRDKTDRKAERKMTQKLLTRDTVALQHIIRLERMLTEHEKKVPARPEELATEWLYPDEDENDEAPRQVRK
jgi:hypothetical protein